MVDINHWQFYALIYHKGLHYRVRVFFICLITCCASVCCMCFSNFIPYLILFYVNFSHGRSILQGFCMKRENILQTTQKKYCFCHCTVPPCHLCANPQLSSPRFAICNVCGFIFNVCVLCTCFEFHVICCFEFRVMHFWYHCCI